MMASDRAHPHGAALRRLACAALLLLAALAPISAADESLAAALDESDECAAGAGDGACGLSALQLRARQRSSDRSGGEQEARAFVEAAPAHLMGWERDGRAPADAAHELVFIVERKGIKKVEELALDRSDPSSPNYGKYLSQQEVRELARNEVGLQALKAALSKVPDIAILSETPGGELVRARAPLATWESLLGTEFHQYRHPEGGSFRLFRAAAYSLPAGLVEHVSGVLRVVDFAPGNFQQGAWGINGSQIMAGAMGCSKDARTVACDTYAELAGIKPVVSPAVIRKTYSMPDVSARGSAGAAEEAETSHMVYASLGQHWSPSDRTEFEGQLGIPQDQYVRELDLGNGKSGDEVCRKKLGACLEANLDVQYMMAMSPWSQMGYYYMDDDTSMYEFLVSFAEFILHHENPPHVISISYGLPEIGATKSVILMFNALAATLALQGVTITVASGDDGAAGALARQQSHGACWLTNQVGLMVSWPASSPWVTAVGATLGAASGHKEVVCSVNATGPAAEAVKDFPPLITSGGGYSLALGRPKYQDGFHNHSGRGIPDVSLAGHAYAIVVGGKWLTVDGTSASSPTFAGMVTLMNARRLAKGLPRLGFVNPLLYKSNMTEAFIDITEGDNKCGSHRSPCCGGYDAGPGWDATSGLGSVNFTTLAGLLKAL